MLAGNFEVEIRLKREFRSIHVLLRRNNFIGYTIQHYLLLHVMNKKIEGLKDPIMIYHWLFC